MGTYVQKQLHLLLLHQLLYGLGGMMMCQKNILILISYFIVWRLAEGRIVKRSAQIYINENSKIGTQVGRSEDFENINGSIVGEKIDPSKGSCRVKDLATKQFLQCEFPFKFKGQTYNGCIDFIDIKNGQKVPGKPWCSTKVRGADREHVSGGSHYGDCNSFCPNDSSVQGARSPSGI